MITLNHANVNVSGNLVFNSIIDIREKYSLIPRLSRHVLLSPEGILSKTLHPR
jgi:hypothetical protein